jgi:integrase
MLALPMIQDDAVKARDIHRFDRGIPRALAQLRNAFSGDAMNSYPTFHTFKTAAESYLEHGGSKRYLARVVAYFDDRPLATIFPFDIHQMAKELYPHQSNATRNRQALTPARAVMMHAYERGWCNLMRLRNFKQEKARRKSPASHIWLHAFVRQCEQDRLSHLAACVIFMAQTAARVSEATALRWREVDLNNRKVVLLKTKTNVNSVRYLTDEMLSRLYKLQEGARPDDPVFRYKSRWSVNDRIKAVCRRAGISYKSSHACGRHSFATNAISLGMDVKTAMEAGEWRSASVFLETYVHAKNAARAVADRFNTYQFEQEI